MATQSIRFSDYNQTSGWKLLNDYTIAEDKHLRDRPFLRTCIPKRIWVDLHDIRVSESLELNDDLDDENSEDRKPKYKRDTCIEARGTLKDVITVFSLEDGALVQASNLSSIQIRPIHTGRLGGKHFATVFDGINYSGMSSTVVPEAGLMDGEPGILYLDDDVIEPSLQAELYLDDENFNKLFHSLKNNSQSIDIGQITMTVELFESEVQASLSEPGMKKEYGILRKDGSNFIWTRARADGLRIYFGKNSSAKELDVVATEGDEETPSREEEIYKKQYIEETIVKSIRSLERRVGWLIFLFSVAVLLMFIQLVS